MASAVHEVFSLEFPNLSLNLFENTLDESLNVVDLHWHGRLEVIHVIEGKGTVTVDFTDMPVSRGDIVVVPPYSLHTVRGRDGQHLSSQTVVFHLDCFRPGRTYTPIIRSGMSGYSELAAVMDMIFLPCAGSAESREIRMRGYATALYALLDCHGYEHPKQEGDGQSSQPIKDVISYIHAHYSQRLDVDQLARIAGYSKYYFVRYFAKHVGCGCACYIQAIRLKKARELLRSTAANITDISQQTGFDSVSYFIKVFRAQTGMTPLQYRNHHIQEGTDIS